MGFPKITVTFIIGFITAYILNMILKYFMGWKTIDAKGQDVKFF